MHKVQEIKVIASRMRMVLRQTEGMPMEAMFWQDLKTLLNMIIDDIKNVIRSGVIVDIDFKTIAERLHRVTQAGNHLLLQRLNGVFWDDLNTLLNLILEEGKDE
jgi:hypothetical protein